MDTSRSVSRVVFPCPGRCRGEGPFFQRISPCVQVIGDGSDHLVGKAFLEELPRPMQRQASNGIASIPVDERRVTASNRFST